MWLMALRIALALLAEYVRTIQQLVRVDIFLIIVREQAILDVACLTHVPNHLLVVPPISIVVQIGSLLMKTAMILITLLIIKIALVLPVLLAVVQKE